MSLTQDATVAISKVANAALAVDATGESIAAQATGYEAAFVSLVDAYLEARNEGATQENMLAAIKTEADAQGVKPHIGSKAPMNVVDTLATFHNLDGDLPVVAGITWVYRPGGGIVPIADGEKSIYALIKQVSQVDEKTSQALKAKGISYGKKVTTAAIKAAKDKPEALANLQALARSFEQALADWKAEQRGPVKAEKHLKAAAGPLSKVAECLDNGQFDDAEEVKRMANGLLTQINAVLAHAALV